VQDCTNVGKNSRKQMLKLCCMSSWKSLSKSEYVGSTNPVNKKTENNTINWSWSKQ